MYRKSKKKNLCKVDKPNCKDVLISEFYITKNIW